MAEPSTNQKFALLAGVGIGAALMYFLDPQRGKARRAIARDRTVAAMQDATRDVVSARRDLRNRVRGLKVELEHRHDPSPDDVQLVERVRAELGHHIDAVSEIEVSAFDGVVTLSGAVSNELLDQAAAITGNVRGVADVCVDSRAPVQ